MAKIKLLTARDITTKPDGYHADGANLFLRVRGDSRVWMFRYKKDGKQISIGLGATHTRNLTEARDIAAQMRNTIANGEDPASVINKQNEEPSMTFKEYAAALIAAKRSEWNNLKHATQWSNTLAQYAYPIIGHKRPADITLADIKSKRAPILLQRLITMFLASCQSFGLKIVCQPIACDLQF